MGLAIALVGAGLVVGLFVLNAGPTNASTNSVTSPTLSGQTLQWPIESSATSSGKLTVSWTTTATAQVTIWAGAPCTTGTGICPVGAALAQWPANLSGRWTLSGSIGAEYVVLEKDLASTDLTFKGTMVEQFSAPGAGIDSFEGLLTLVGAAVLLAIGAIGVFLGLFLPGGVYRDAPEPPRLRPGLAPLDDTYDDLEPEQAREDDSFRR